MSQLFAVVHEAEADFTTATGLADRVLVETIDWLEEDLLTGQRLWISQASGGVSAPNPSLRPVQAICTSSVRQAPFCGRRKKV
jgi:hypothetical protein